MKTNRPLLALGGLALAVTLAACGTSTSGGSGGSTAAASGSKSVTVYSADGLADWYQPQFKAFTAATGIKVNYVEAGSSEVVSRIEKERSNPQADVLVTLPPFIQQADKDGMLAPLGVDTSMIAAKDKDAGGHWTNLVDNYSCWIVSTKDTPAPKTWQDMLSASYKGKLQYSTPGQAGDGTAVLVLLEHEMGQQGALAYLKKLQANNVGPSSSTGKLQPKVSSGELLAANGDVQMNLDSIAADKSAFQVFFPSNGSAAPTTLALPYSVGLTSNAPHSANGQKLISFLLASTAQQQVSSAAFGIPVNTSVHPTDASFTQLQAAIKGVTIYTPDWNQVLSSLDSDVSAYNDAIGG